MDVCLYFSTVFEEFFSMSQFEIKVMVFRIRTESNFLYDGLRCFCLEFFLLFLSRVQEFIVVNDLANRRIGFRANFNKVKVHVTSPIYGLVGVVDIGSDFTTCNGADILKVVPD